MPIIITSILMSFSLFAFDLGTWPKVTPALLGEGRTLFSHNRHEKTLQEMKINCQDCHTFSFRPKDPGPLGKTVTEKILSHPKGVCHQCHLQELSHPRLSRCTLCHVDSSELKPKDHFIHWNKLHGQVAQMDSDSCLKCHGKSGCTDCHIKRDRMNHKVHRGNFRLMHSIEARLDPQKCVTCHQSPRFCLDCHQGKH